MQNQLDFNIENETEKTNDDYSIHSRPLHSSNNR